MTQTMKKLVPGSKSLPVTRLSVKPAVAVLHLKDSRARLLDSRWTRVCRRIVRLLTTDLKSIQRHLA
jgi:hypothetical protein